MSRLRARRTEIETRWKTLLNVEGAANPLATPEMLAGSVPTTLTEILDQAVTAPTADHHGCLRRYACGYNPFSVLYTTGEQAIAEMGVEIQFGQAPQDRRGADLISVTHSLHQRATDDIEAFCGVCAHRGIARTCPFRTANAESDAALAHT